MLNRDSFNHTVHPQIAPEVSGENFEYQVHADQFVRLKCMVCGIVVGYSPTPGGLRILEIAHVCEVQKPATHKLEHGDH